MADSKLQCVLKKLCTIQIRSSDIHPHGHMTTFWRLGYWPTFMAICNTYHVTTFYWQKLPHSEQWVFLITMVLALQLQHLINSLHSNKGCKLVKSGLVTWPTLQPPWHLIDNFITWGLPIISSVQVATSENKVNYLF